MHTVKWNRNDKECRSRHEQVEYSTGMRDIHKYSKHVSDLLF